MRRESIRAAQTQWRRARCVLSSHSSFVSTPLTKTFTKTCESGLVRSWRSPPSPLTALFDRRLANNEVDGKRHKGFGLVAGDGADALQERLRGQFAQASLLLAHRRQRRVRHSGHLHV